MSPLFVHDCPNCRYIATATVLGRLFDLYRSCRNTEGFILRYSDQGGNYQTVYPPTTPLTRTTDDRLALQMDYHLCLEIERETHARQYQHR